METTDHSVAHSASLALSSDGFQEKLALVEQITREIFPGEVRIERVEDPEIENHVFYLFHFYTALDFTSLDQKRSEWYDRTWKAIAEDCQYVHLAVNFSK